MEDLNDDCLVLIFSSLGVSDKIRCQRVNRRWKGLMAEVHRSQTSLALMPYPFRKVSDHSSLDMFVADVFGIGHKDVLGDEWYNIELDQSTQENVLKKFPNIFNLEVMTMTPRLLYFIDETYPSLKALCFHSVSKDMKRVQFSGLSHLSKSIRRLAVGVSVSNEWIEIMISRKIFPNLEEFYCISSECGLEAFHNSITLNIFDSVGSNFKKLYLGNRYILSYGKCSTRDQAVKTHNIRQVKEFEAVGCIQESNSPMDDHLRHFKHLQKLGLNCIRLSSAQLTLLNNYKMLHSLNLILSPGMLGNLPQVLEKMKHLKKLTLRGPELVIPAKDFKGMVVLCRQLCYIHLETLFSRESEDSCAELICTHLANIQHLRLPYSDLRTQDVHKILQGCPQLKTIDLNYCKLLDPSVSNLFISYAISHKDRRIEAYLLEAGAKVEPRDLPANCRLCTCSSDMTHSKLTTPPKSFHANHVKPL